MAHADLILLHAPSVYDFRRRPALYGPVSDVVPSTHVFEMYPIGFLTMMEHLEHRGLSVRIINIAVRMLNRRRFDAVRLIKSLRPAAFGLDLHWLVHAQGSLEVARIVKECHPDIPVIFGGLSASYYHEELIRYPQVDYVLRGDSVEEPLFRLISAIKEHRAPSDVPNLVWKDDSGIHDNGISNIPHDLNEVSFDYRAIMKSAARHLDLTGHLPFKTWLRYPIVAALSCRGCAYDCATCGGSASAYASICGRRHVAYRDPIRMAQDVSEVSRHIRAPIIVLGDIRQAGEEYARDFFAALKQAEIRNHIALEFFSPPHRDFLEMAAGAVPNFNIQMSPESHDERVRRVFGRPYGNEALEKSISDALEVGCRRFDLFFMIGIREQTQESVMATVDYCERLLRRFGRNSHAGKVHPYISPLAPFLDPGSRAFAEPEKFGYRLFYRSLEEHRMALLAPSWKYVLNYETRWMTRDQIVQATYEAASRLNGLKAAYGLVSRRATDRIASRIEKERRIVAEIDRIMSVEDDLSRELKLRELMRGFEATGDATICGKKEMNWSVDFVRFNPLRIFKSLVTRAQFATIKHPS